MKHYFLVIISILCLQLGCSPKDHKGEPDIVKYLSKDLEGYQLVKARTHKEGRVFSIRYNKVKESNHSADVYIWPKPKNANANHQDFVSAATQRGIRDIFSLQKSGHYENVKILEQGQLKVDDTIITKSSLSFLKRNLSTISHLYITQVEDKILKVSISLPNNETNLSRSDIDIFSSKILLEIKSQLAKTIDES